MQHVDLFETIDTLRAVRRLKPDPVPLELIRRILRSGTMAPSGQNTQPWRFIVVRDPLTKRFIQELYHRAMLSRLGRVLVKRANDNSMPAKERAWRHVPRRAFPRSPSATTRVRNARLADRRAARGARREGTALIRLGLSLHPEHLARVPRTRTRSQPHDCAHDLP